jgi:hypothetical protein
MPTSFGLIRCPTLCRRFKRLGARSLLQRRPAPPDFECVAGDLLPGVPLGFGCLGTGRSPPSRPQPTQCLELTNPACESNAGHIRAVLRCGDGGLPVERRPPASDSDHPT